MIDMYICPTDIYEFLLPPTTPTKTTALQQRQHNTQTTRRTSPSLAWLSRAHRHYQVCTPYLLVLLLLCQNMMCARCFPMQTSRRATTTTTTTTGAATEPQPANTIHQYPVASAEQNDTLSSDMDLYSTPPHHHRNHTTQQHRRNHRLVQAARHRHGHGGGSVGLASITLVYDRDAGAALAQSSGDSSSAAYEQRQQRSLAIDRDDTINVLLHHSSGRYLMIPEDGTARFLYNKTSHSILQFHDIRGGIASRENVITIKGVVANLYLCINSTGRVVLQPTVTNGCHFKKKSRASEHSFCTRTHRNSTLGRRKRRKPWWCLAVDDTTDEAAVNFKRKINRLRPTEKFKSESYNNSDTSAQIPETEPDVQGTELPTDAADTESARRKVPKKCRNKTGKAKRKCIKRVESGGSGGSSRRRSGGASPSWPLILDREESSRSSAHRRRHSRSAIR